MSLLASMPASGLSLAIWRKGRPMRLFAKAPIARKRARNVADESCLARSVADKNLFAKQLRCEADGQVLDAY